MTNDRTPAGERRWDSRLARAHRYLRPGIGLKRWLVVVFLGELLLASAGALILRQVYRGVAPDDPTQSPLLYLLTLQFLPLPLRPVVLLGIGVGLFLFGFWRLIGNLVAPFNSGEEPLVELIYQKRSLARGPRIVAIGGGTGLSTLLRGLKEFSSNITAVVTVADDGGSSGKLRTELGIPPVGDIRNCIAALADAEPLMTSLMHYRFPADSQETNGLSGHAFGNLLIAALTAVEGDFEQGVRHANRVLAVRGQVVPVAPVPLTLHAELSDGRWVEGESLIARHQGIRRVWIAPPDVRASVEAVEAIARADLIVLGPGSLYTSLLPSLLVPQIRAALLSASAARLYVCNVATQVGETEGYTLADHLAALQAHNARDVVDVVLVNDNFAARTPRDYGAAPVRFEMPPPAQLQPRIVHRDVVDLNNAHYHDAAKLAAAIVEIHETSAGRRRVAVPKTA
ncbi:MAG: gluconeogenesis factor YvcK family protein [Candidatus Limnocylindrales bacterium]